MLFLIGTDSVLLEFFTQRGAIQAQHFGGTALIATAMRHHFNQQGRLHFSEQYIVQIMLIALAHIVQIAAHYFADHVFECRQLFRIGRGVVDEVQRVHVELIVVFLPAVQFIAKHVGLSE
jgi:hypothetical protein